MTQSFVGGLKRHGLRGVLVDCLVDAVNIGPTGDTEAEERNDELKGGGVVRGC